MNRSSFSVLLGSLLILSFWRSSPSWGAEAPQKYALLIAVAKYDHAEMNKPQLDFPEVDARALGELLQSAGYKVDLLLGKQATQAAIREKLGRLNRQGSADGVVLVGLSGHGVDVETRDEKGNVVSESCFCPFDATIRFATDGKGRKVLGDDGQALTEPEPETLVKLSELMTSLKVARAGSRMVFTDCCRKVPNKAKGRSFGSSFKATDLPENTSVMFGCSPNEQAFEHKDWGHGAFTKCLLEELRDLSAAGRVTTGVLADRLKEKVPQLVARVSPRDRQTPKAFFTDSIDLQLVISEPVLTNSLEPDAKTKVLPKSTSKPRYETRLVSCPTCQGTGSQSGKRCSRCGGSRFTRVKVFLPE